MGIFALREAWMRIYFFRDSWIYIFLFSGNWFSIFLWFVKYAFTYLLCEPTTFAGIFLHFLEMLASLKLKNCPFDALTDGDFKLTTATVNQGGLESTIRDKSLRTDLHFWRFCAQVRRTRATWLSLCNFHVKRDCLLFSVNVKLFFEFFVMREKVNFSCVKLFTEEVYETL